MIVTPLALLDINSTARLILTELISHPVNADFRHNCGRLLFRGYLTIGTHLEMRCPRCGTLAVYDARLPESNGNGHHSEENKHESVPNTAQVEDTQLVVAKSKTATGPLPRLVAASPQG